MVGIHLTQVAPTCSMASDGGFPTGSTGIRGSVLDGSGLPGVSVSAPLARGILLPALWRAKELANIRRSAAMFGLQLPKFGDGRDDLSGYPQAPDALVPGGLVGHQPEERCERHGPSTGAGTEELQDGLDVAA